MHLSEMEVVTFPIRFAKLLGRYTEETGDTQYFNLVAEYTNDILMMQDKIDKAVVYLEQAEFTDSKFAEAVSILDNMVISYNNVVEAFHATIVLIEDVLKKGGIQ